MRTSLYGSVFWIGLISLLPLSCGDSEETGQVEGGQQEATQTGAIRFTLTVSGFPERSETVPQLGTVRTEESGILCGTAGSTCSMDLPKGTTVKLLAIPDEYRKEYERSDGAQCTETRRFEAWGGACSSASASSGECVLQIDRDMDVYAEFLPYGWCFKIGN